MLRPLAAALRFIDQDEKAVEVCRAAVRLGGPDDDAGRVPRLAGASTWP